MSDQPVLAVVTSHREINGVPTGFFLPELAYPYHHLTRKGLRVHIASPTGGLAPINPWSDPRNPHGMESGDLVSLGFLNWQPAQEAVAETTPLDDIDPSGYAAVWVVGGVGPVFDLADNSALHQILSVLWAAGKPVSAICHGVIALAGLTIDTSPVVEGLEVTGYSKAEDMGIERSIPVPDFQLPCYVEEELGASGGIYRSAAPGLPLVVQAAHGQLLTGQNQQSADAFGRALAERVRA